MTTSIEMPIFGDIKELRIFELPVILGSSLTLELFFTLFFSSLRFAISESNICVDAELRKWRAMSGSTC